MHRKFGFKFICLSEKNSEGKENSYFSTKNWQVLLFKIRVSESYFIDGCDMTSA